FSFSATCLVSSSDLSSSDFLSSFLLSLLDDFVSFLSSNSLSSCPHAANTKKLANNKNNNFFISHSPFFDLYLYYTLKHEKENSFTENIFQKKRYKSLDFGKTMV